MKKKDIKIGGVYLSKTFRGHIRTVFAIVDGYVLYECSNCDPSDELHIVPNSEFMDDNTLVWSTF
jgi:hypothetical protein